MLKAIKTEIEECYELATGALKRRRRRPILNGAKNFSIWSVVGYSSPAAMNLPSGLGASPCTASFPEVSQVQRRAVRKKEYQWEVSRIGGEAAKLLGIVYALGV
jgi:hypothetical protein